MMSSPVSTGPLSLLELTIPSAFGERDLVSAADSGLAGSCPSLLPLPHVLPLSPSIPSAAPGMPVSLSCKLHCLKSWSREHVQKEAYLSHSV